MLYFHKVKMDKKKDVFFKKRFFVKKEVTTVYIGLGLGDDEGMPSLRDLRAPCP